MNERIKAAIIYGLLPLSLLYIMLFTNTYPFQLIPSQIANIPTGWLILIGGAVYGYSIKKKI